MRDRLNISKEEYRAIEPILKEISSRVEREITLNELLNDWRYFVEEIARGYNDSLDDYTNDLSIRDLLEDIMRRIPRPLKDKINNVLNPIDKKFFIVTKEIEKSLLYKVDAGSWWYRIPMNYSGEFEEDLKSLGFIED